MFEAITFTEDDMEDKDPYIFTITEVVPSETNGITYSDKSYTAEVTLSDDGLGHIIPLVTVNGETKSAENNVFTVGDFANTYKAEGSFKLEGTKAVEDKDGNKGESRTFTFSLRYKGDTASDPVMTGTVTLNDGGTADITFTPAEAKLDTELLAELVEDGKATLDSTGEKPVWTILYTLTEDATGYADIVLNGQEIEVTVTVTDNGDGTLACEVKPARADIAFTNEERGSAEIGITGGKKLEGRALTENDKWTFTISSETGDLQLRQHRLRLRTSEPGRICEDLYLYGHRNRQRGQRHQRRGSFKDLHRDGFQGCRRRNSGRDRSGRPR